MLSGVSGWTLISFLPETAVVPSRVSDKHKVSASLQQSLAQASSPEKSLDQEAVGLHEPAANSAVWPIFQLLFAL